MITQLGRNGIRLMQQFGRAGIFLGRLLCRLPRIVRTFPMIISQIVNVGVRSLSIIGLSALFIGMVVALQGYSTLVKFGADIQLGQLLALSILRELAPVVTALLFAGRAGSALTAEIGLMKTTEQLNSLEMMGVDPVWRVAYPRFWAALISLPLLTTIFAAIAIWGGYIVGIYWLGLDAGSFWSNMQSAVDFRSDVIAGLSKSLVFGVLVAWIAIYHGYASTPTAEGIGQATTRSVVHASLAILCFDFVLTSFMLGAW